MGYAFAPFAKITPEAGAPVVYDLRSALTYVAGPVKCVPKYTPEVVTREDVNSRLSSRLDGFRVEVDLVFQVGGTMDDHAILAAIVNALMHPGASVALSLDGGLVYRDVILVKYAGPTPLGGKTFAGAQFELTLRCVELISEVPAIGTGRW